jgi:alpha-mannosidase
VLWTLKPAEEGIDVGVIARVWNLSLEQRSFSLSLAPGIESARRVTHIETDMSRASVKKGNLSESLAPMQVATYRLQVPPP